MLLGLVDVMGVILRFVFVSRFVDGCCHSSQKESSNVGRNAGSCLFNNLVVWFRLVEVEECVFNLRQRDSGENDPSNVFITTKLNT